MSWKQFKKLTLHNNVLWKVDDKNLIIGAVNWPSIFASIISSWPLHRYSLKWLIDSQYLVSIHLCILSFLFSKIWLLECSWFLKTLFFIKLWCTILNINELERYHYHLLCSWHCWLPHKSCTWCCMWCCEFWDLSTLSKCFNHVNCIQKCAWESDPICTWMWCASHCIYALLFTWWSFAHNSL